MRRQIELTSKRKKTLLQAIQRGYIISSDLPEFYENDFVAAMERIDREHGDFEQEYQINLSREDKAKLLSAVHVGYLLEEDAPPRPTMMDVMKQAFVEEEEDGK
jgi:hypothetical protein